MTDLFKRFEQLNAIGASLSSERNIDRLLENILLAAKAITHADGGTLYRMILVKQCCCWRQSFMRTAVISPNAQVDCLPRCRR